MDDGCICMEENVFEWMDGCIDGFGRWMNGCVKGMKNGWMAI